MKKLIITRVIIKSSMIDYDTKAKLIFYVTQFKFISEKY